MAPGAYHVVLRDLPLNSLPSRLPALSSRFSVCLQFLLQGIGSASESRVSGIVFAATAQQVQDYRAYVDRHMLELLGSGDVATFRDAVELGVNHEQQHQELILTDIKHAFWSQPLRPAYALPTPSPESRERGVSWFGFDAGVYKIGYEGDVFAFDNERPRHQVYLNEFQIASRLVTNAEYMAFMNDDGYLRPELWLSDGWDTMNAQGWRAPLYWEHQGDEWMAFTAAGMQKVNPREPVCHVSFYEADAYARWAKARLTTEAEWEVVAANVPMDGNFLEGGYLHPIPEPEREGAPQSDVWRCMGVDGESVCWLSGIQRRTSVRWASTTASSWRTRWCCAEDRCVTPASHMRATYRNFFPPHTRWQYSGIRLAK